MDRINLPSYYTKEDLKIIKLFTDEMDRINLLYIKAIKSNDITKANQLLKKIKSIANTLWKEYGKRADIKIPTEYLKGADYISDTGIDDFYDLSEKQLKVALGELGPIHVEAVNALLNNSKNYVKSSLDGMERQAMTMLNELQQEKVREELAKGTISGDNLFDMNKRVEKYFMDNGITGFKDRGGKYWTMDRYIDMLTRTETSIANTQGTINSALEIGITKFRVVERPDCCKDCDIHDGDIVDISEGEVDLPPYHPNCRGFIIAVVEYPGKLSEEELDRVLFSVGTDKEETYIINNGITKDIGDIMDGQGYRKGAFKNVINTSGVKHLLERHGVGAEKKRGQRPITFDDIKKIPEIVYNHDSIADRGKSKNSMDVIAIKKNIDGEEYNYRMRINIDKKIIEPQSFFIKTKKGAN